LSAHKSSAYWAAYSQAGDKMVTGGADKMVYLWDRKSTSKPLKKLVGNESIVRSVGFMNNDKHIISTTLEGEITIFDTKSGEIVVHEK
jgi:WD40 repeat protein